ncbi:leucine-rich repeat protein [Hepatocystis sp. ex Piliocolobus tephrosceles]|nr:leucine-rich repeat protein [Hepatocystis sp. ex Piliocolobus tephrosceles]
MFRYLQNNDISTIENINCSSIVILNLSNNKIKKISNLKHLKFLEKLNISNNLIENIEDLNEVTHLESLTHLDISNNLLNITDEGKTQKLSDYVEKGYENCSGEKCNISEIKNELKQTSTEGSTTCSNTPITEQNEDSKIFEMYLYYYENFKDEIVKEKNCYTIKYHPNVETMDQPNKKKFFFLCEFILLLKKIKNLKTLFVKNNPFVNKIRHVPKYLIANVPHLLFLDDQKIKKENICLARVFLKHGKIAENELQKLFAKKKNEKYKNLTEKFHSFLLSRSEKQKET